MILGDVAAAGRDRVVVTSDGAGDGRDAGDGGQSREQLQEQAVLRHSQCAAPVCLRSRTEPHALHTGRC